MHKVTGFISQVPALGIANACAGWQHGASIGRIRATGAEIKQGKNYWLTFGPSVQGINIATSTINRVNSYIPSTVARISAYTFFTVVNLLSMPTLVMCAASAHGSYKEIAEVVNSLLKEGGIDNLFGMTREGVIQLPKTVSDETAKRMLFLIENAGKMAFVATIVGMVALAVLGEGMFCLGTVVALGYSWIAHETTYIPLDVKVFIENWSPVIQFIGAVFGGGGIVMMFWATINLVLSDPDRFHAVLRELEGLLVHVADHIASIIPEVIIPEGIIPDLETRTHMRNSLLRTHMRNSLLSKEFSEATAPFVNPVLNFKTMKRILSTSPDTPDGRAQLNLTCLAKFYGSSLEHLKEEDRDFDKFLDVFADVLNPERDSFPTKVFARAIVGDNRFKGEVIKNIWPNYRAVNIQKLPSPMPSFFAKWLEENYPDCGNNLDEATFEEIEEIKSSRTICQLGDGRWTSPEGLIRILAKEKNVTEARYLSDYLRSQLWAFIEGLKNKQPVKAEEQRQLKDAIDGFSKILPYVRSANLSLVDKEGMLSRLAIEGAKYCASGLQQLKEDLMDTFVVGEKEKEWTPLRKYESEIFTGLNQVREAIAGNFARKASTPIDGGTGQIAQDRHQVSNLRRLYSYGFVPIGDYSLRHRFGFGDFLVWKTGGGMVRRLVLYPPFLEHLYQPMRTGLEKSEFFSYMSSKINSMPSTVLTDEQKEELLYGIDGDLGEKGLVGAATDDKVLVRYQVLLYTMLGILKPPTVEA